MAFDDSDFAELIERASSQGPDRVRSAVDDTGDLIASLVSVIAAVVTAALLHPLAPVVVLAALPRGWAAVRSARLMFDSFVRMNSQRRRSHVTSRLITERDPAAEVRAFTTQEVLLAEHRRIAEEIAVEAVRLERDRTVVQLIGRALSGVGSALAYLVLALLLYSEVLPLAVAGAAAVAMRSASQAVSTGIFQMNRLYEAAFFLDLFRSGVDDARARVRIGRLEARDPVDHRLGAAARDSGADIQARSYADDPAVGT